jgi:hypothetical protein
MRLVSSATRGSGKPIGAGSASAEVACGAVSATSSLASRSIAVRSGAPVQRPTAVASSKAERERVDLSAWPIWKGGVL